MVFVFQSMMIRKRVIPCGKEGTGVSRNNTKPKIIAVIAAVGITATVLLFLGVGGGIEYQFDDASFSIHTKMWKDRTVAYADIESIELRDNIDEGKRTNGYGSGKLNLGTFQNSEFSTYQLYSYAECREFIVLQLKDKDNTILVINGEDKNATHDIFEEMSLRK